VPEEQLQIGDIPEYVLRVMSEHLKDHVIGIVGVPPPPGDPCLHGSGTLVKVDDVYGILTADHVIQDYLAKTEYSRAAVISYPARCAYQFHLEDFLSGAITIARNPDLSSQYGPDLAFVVLPPEYVSEMKQDAAPVEIFHDLIEPREKVLQGTVDLHSGVWYACGFFGEWSRPEEEHTEAGIVRTPHFRSTAGARGPRGEPATTLGYDHFDLGVQRYPRDYLPQSFGGMSGGGVWLVPLVKYDAGGYDLQAMCSAKTLLGVIFGEVVGYSLDANFEIKELLGVYTLRCQGWRSIYSNVVEAIRSHVA
jgi:hypothetical protein